MTTLCSVRSLRKAYPSFLLSDISFSLNAGRITGFIGRNGAGKTITIKSIRMAGRLISLDCLLLNISGKSNRRLGSLQERSTITRKRNSETLPL